MVSQYPAPEERMMKRIGPPLDGPANIMNAGVIAAANLVPPPWRIEIPANDGTMLLVLREENGQLCAEYDESRVNEAARALLTEMMRWSGGAGIHWKDEAQLPGKIIR